MADTIDVEAKELAQLILDIDRHRRRYVIKEGNFRVKFVSPIIGTFERYRFFLLRNSEFRTLEQRYYYRPDYLSYDEYGSTVMWPLLLYINDIPLIEQFDKELILVPSFSAISEIAKFDLSKLDPLDVDELNKEPTNTFYLNLYSSKVFPKTEQTENVVSAVEEESVSYIRQKFVLSATNILNGFVDLGYIPIIESVDFKISGQSIIPIYDTHYTIIEDVNGETRRVSWLASDNQDGDGLESVLEEGMRLELQYTKRD